MDHPTTTESFVFVKEDVDGDGGGSAGDDAEMSRSPSASCSPPPAPFGMTPSPVTLLAIKAGGKRGVGRLVDSTQADDRRMIHLVRDRPLLYARSNLPVASYQAQVKKLWREVADIMGWTGGVKFRPTSLMRNAYRGRRTEAGAGAAWPARARWMGPQLENLTTPYGGRPTEVVPHPQLVLAPLAERDPRRAHRQGEAGLQVVPRRRARVPARAHGDRHARVADDAVLADAVLEPLPQGGDGAAAGGGGPGRHRPVVRHAGRRRRRGLGAGGERGLLPVLPRHLQGLPRAGGAAAARLPPPVPHLPARAARRGGGRRPRPRSRPGFRTRQPLREGRHRPRLLSRLNHALNIINIGS